MTKSKTQKVKVKVEDVKEVKEGKISKSSLDEFIERLGKIAEETADKLGLRTKKPNDYYVSYCFRKEDDTLEFGSACFGTNVNPFAKCGFGMRMLEDKIKSENHIKSEVIILNVIKLGLGEN